MEINRTLMMVRRAKRVKPSKEAVGLSDGVTAYLLYNGSATYIL